MTTQRSTGLIAVGVLVLVLSVAGGVTAFVMGDDGSDDVATPADDVAVDADTDADVGASDEPVEDGEAARVQVPEGQQAVALTLGRTAGLAGHLRAGDRVDVYGVVAEAPDSDNTVRRALADVETLSVSDGDGDITVLLALPADEVETAVFLSSFESLWLSLVGDGDQPGDTPGATYSDL